MRPLLCACAERERERDRSSVSKDIPPMGFRAPSLWSHLPLNTSLGVPSPNTITCKLRLPHTTLRWHTYVVHCTHCENRKAIHFSQILFIIYLFVKITFFFLKDRILGWFFSECSIISISKISNLYKPEFHCFQNRFPPWDHLSVSTVKILLSEVTLDWYDCSKNKRIVGWAFVRPFWEFLSLLPSLSWTFCSMPSLCQEFYVNSGIFIMDFIC